MPVLILPNLSYVNNVEQQVKEVNKPNSTVYFGNLWYNLMDQTALPLLASQAATIGFPFSNMNGIIVDNRDETDEISTDFKFTQVGLYCITIHLAPYGTVTDYPEVKASLYTDDSEAVTQSVGVVGSSPIVLHYYNSIEESSNAHIDLMLNDSSYSGTYQLSLSDSMVVIEYLGSM